jgi:hypothetical protein
VSRFRVVDVSDWAVVQPEPQGRSGKEWLREDGTPLNAKTRERDWLFKPVVVHENGQRQGGNWAERIVAELGTLLGLPCAEVELAVRGDDEGSISRNVAPDGWNLMPGNVLLAALLPGYTGGERLPGRPGHTVGNIMDALRTCGAPPGFERLDAVGVFAGYLVLDALVANQDRHDRNWAVLERADAPGPRLLAASYDHTSSLGFNLLDAARRRTLGEAGGIAKWADRGRASQFEHDATAKSTIPTLVDVARDALSRAGPVPERHWLARVQELDDDAIEGVVARVPGLSDATATFILRLLATNRRRLTDDCR